MFLRVLFGTAAGIASGSQRYDDHQQQSGQLHRRPLFKKFVAVGLKQTNTQSKVSPSPTQSSMQRRPHDSSRLFTTRWSVGRSVMRSHLLNTVIHPHDGQRRERVKAYPSLSLSLSLCASIVAMQIIALKPCSNTGARSCTHL